jgi:hypothetical protein
LRTSERGSAVVEFLLLILPMLGLTAGSIGVSWFAFSKVQLQEVAQELAVFHSEPDTDEVELNSFAAQLIGQRFGRLDFHLTAIPGSVAIDVPASELGGPFALVLPNISAESHVPQQL